MHLRGRQSEVIRGDEANRGELMALEPMHLMREAIRGHQRSSEAMRQIGEN
jgi:hypothetical protein